MIAVANVYANEKDYDKARKWFENALRVNPSNGDIWAYYYNMEINLNNETTSLLSRCKDAAPTQGELWTEYSSRIENWKLDTIDLLIKVQRDISQNEELQ
jgi:pre-mRNA-processing factor 6